MGLIRVSDYAENLIKEHSHGRTITATVDAILAGSVAPDGTEMWKGQKATDNDLLEYLDKRFDELKALITDSLVDVVAAGSGRAPGEKPGGKEWVKWEQMQYIIFNREDDDPAWVIPEGAVFSFKNGDPNELAYYIKDGTIYIDGPQPVAILKVTPDIREAIDKNFTFND